MCRIVKMNLKPEPGNARQIGIRPTLRSSSPDRPELPKPRLVRVVPDQGKLVVISIE